LLVVPQLALGYQMAVFAFVAVVSIALGRRYLKRRPVRAIALP